MFTGRDRKKKTRGCETINYIQNSKQIFPDNYSCTLYFKPGLKPANNE